MAEESAMAEKRAMAEKSAMAKESVMAGESVMIAHTPESRPFRVSRPVLWALLAVFAVCNMVTSMSDLPVLVGIGFGLATGACAATLIAQHYAERRR